MKSGARSPQSLPRLGWPQDSLGTRCCCSRISGCVIFQRQSFGARKPLPVCIDGPTHCRSTRNWRRTKVHHFAKQPLLEPQTCCVGWEDGMKRWRRYWFCFATNNGAFKRNCDRPNCISTRGTRATRRAFLMRSNPSRSRNGRSDGFCADVWS